MKEFNNIVIKDPHFMFGFRNNIRKPGWESDIDNKLNQVIEYAVNNSIKKIQFTGDVSEKSRRRDWSLSQLQQNKKRLQLFKDAQLILISNLGNHDYFDGREELKGTAFNEYVQSNLLIYRGTNSEPVINELDDHIVIEFGIDYHHSKEVILNRLAFIRDFHYDSSKKVRKILTMHSNITNSEERLTDFTYNQLAEYNIDIINCGHYHIQSELGACAKVKDTLFINPWNFTRVSRDYNVKMDEHIPEFIHVKITKDEIFTSIHKLRVRPFAEAFDAQIVNLMQELGKTDFTFFEEIDLDGMQNDLRDEDAIDLLAKNGNFSKEAIKLAKELMS